VTANPKRSGVFAPIDPQLQIEKTVEIDRAPHWDD
jgi:hypothetical protein